MSGPRPHRHGISNAYKVSYSNGCGSAGSAPYHNSIADKKLGDVYCELRGADCAGDRVQAVELDCDGKKIVMLRQEAGQYDMDIEGLVLCAIPREAETQKTRGRDSL